MHRVFTRTIGRFQAGEERDYARAVWDQIARSAKQPLEAFTKPVDEVLQGAVGAARKPAPKK